MSRKRKGKKEAKTGKEKTRMGIIGGTHWGSRGSSRASVSSRTNRTLENRRGQNFVSVMSHLESLSHPCLNPGFILADMAAALQDYPAMCISTPWSKLWLSRHTPLWLSYRHTKQNQILLKGAHWKDHTQGTYGCTAAFWLYRQVVNTVQHCDYEVWCI